MRLELGKYVCREWNKRHAQKDRVYSYKVWLMPELHLLNGTSAREGGEVCMYTGGNMY